LARPDFDEVRKIAAFFYLNVSFFSESLNILVMKFLYYFNFAIVLITGALCVPGLWGGDYSIGLMAAFYLGIFQVFFGLVMILFNFKSRMLWIYAIGVIVFFLLLEQYLAWFLPPILAVYFTCILHVKTFKTRL
jgi:hypothetical protein